MWKKLLTGPSPWALIVLGISLVLLLPAPGQARQSVDPPRLVEPDEEVSDAVKSVIAGYYRRWKSLPPSALGGPVCDADLGQDCLGRDVDGGCNARRCRSEEEIFAFLHRMGGLVESFPNSPLPLSHAVYAAVKLGHLEIANDLLEGCSSAGNWWCDLSAAYLLHRSGQSARAGPHFQRALVAMPSPLRCGLEDILVLLPRDVLSEYEGLPCEARAEAHRWFWWTADPFLVEEGNERWSEHLVRGFEGMINQDLRERVQQVNFFRPMGYSPDVIRRGFHDSFDRTAIRVAPRHTTSVRWTSRRAAFNHFIPEVLSLTGLRDDLHYRLEAKIERISSNRVPGDEGYSRLAGFVLPVLVQVARFREGDSLEVALASDLESAGLVSTDQAFFVASENPEHVAALEAAPLQGTVRFAARVANQKQVVGVEAFTPGPEGRHRQVLQPLDAAARVLSDILLFGPLGADLPDTRLGAVALMHGSPRVPRDLRLGLYWEAYGLSTEETLRISIRLEKQGGGWVSGVIRAIGFGGVQERGEVSWSETVKGDDPFRSAIALDLLDIDPGEYDLIVEMEREDGGRLTQTRRFEVIGRGPP